MSQLFDALSRGGQPRREPKRSQGPAVHDHAVLAILGCSAERMVSGRGRFRGRLGLWLAAGAGLMGAWVGRAARRRARGPDRRI